MIPVGAPLVALLAALAAPDGPPPAPTVWLARASTTETAATRVSNELRELGYAVVPAEIEAGAAADGAARRLLAGAPGRRRALVVLRPAPALAEIWWADEHERSDHEALAPETPTTWTRLDAIRIAETVRARLSPPVAQTAGATTAADATATVAGTGAPTVVAAPPSAPTPTHARLHFAVGPSVSSFADVDRAAGLTLAASVALSTRNRIGFATTLPLQDTATTDGKLTSRDTVLALAVERTFGIFPLGPGRFELRGAAGLALHRWHRESHFTTYSSTNKPYPYAGVDESTAYSGGPTLAGAIAYNVRDRWALVATAGGGIVLPSREVVLQGYALVPGLFTWTLGLALEIGLWPVS